MSVKKLINPHFFKPVYAKVFLLSIMGATIIWGADTLRKEWRLGFLSLWQSGQNLNYVKYSTVTTIEKITHEFVKNNEPGLKQVKLYIPKKNQTALMKDMPTHIKDWQKAYLLYPNNRVRPVKVRHRGDNPLNWAYEKKSWRIKTKKKRLIDGLRTFNLIVSCYACIADDYLTYYLGQLAGILSPYAQLVELWINDKPYGIYLWAEHIDEVFLRKRNLMPVNIYKGEQYNAERLNYIDNFLFGNPYLWKKISRFNQQDQDDYSDLAYFIDMIRDAMTSSKAFDSLQRIATFEDWAKFSAFQTLVRSWHNSPVHNQRLVSDPLRGTIKPVLHDTGTAIPLPKTYVSSVEKYAMPKLDEQSHALLDLYHRSSRFLVKKYGYLYKFIESGTLIKAASHIEDILPNIEKSLTRDPFRNQIAETTHIDSGQLSISAVIGKLKRRAKSFRLWHAALKTILETSPQANWWTTGASMSLVIGGSNPLTNLTLDFDSPAKLGQKFFWDADDDGQISDADIEISHHVDGNRIALDGSWLANKVSVLTSTIPKFYHFKALAVGIIKDVPTQFGILSNFELNLKAVSASNQFTGKRVSLPKNKTAGMSRSKYNEPIFQQKPTPMKDWKGLITIDKDQIIDYPVRILPGAELAIAGRVSLVFRNRVMIEGEKDQPVVIRRQHQDEPWGTVAILGSGASGSRLRNVNISGGSGGKVENIHYSAMLSIRDTQDVIVDSVQLRDNVIYDDMMHVLYSDNIHIRDSLFTNSFSDALDVDISKITIRNSTFDVSGNDAIDFMNSNALVSGTQIRRAGDKGISIGENSKVFVYRSKLTENATGIETKDSSNAWVSNSNFINNKIQFNAYKKNWRYGGGGSLIIDKSILRALRNKITADKKSEILVYDSIVSPPYIGKSKNVTIDVNSSSLSNKVDAKTEFHPEIVSELGNWGLKSDLRRRGVEQ
ncbi:MAG: hypothetical protein CMM60_03205 [Rhodospirillaceae bacterium]|jgi:hypothetical protein|nr:hypothetical protein [Rhodospirillaceae bacterium]|tara:strand:+ start:1717 stop:4551 length:2835 start_codon:yes stop_codon:yes gene_type:complete